MWDNDCGVIPVTDDDGRVVGMITDRDICMAAYIRGKAPQIIQVSEVMAKEVFSCNSDDLLSTAERIMNEKQVRRVPVLDGDNSLVGVLSLNDIARYAVTTKKKNGLERDLVHTLARICQPRSRAAQAAELLLPPTKQAAPKQIAI